MNCLHGIRRAQLIRRGSFSVQTDTRNHPSDPSVRAGCSPGHPETDQDPTRWHSRTPVAVRTPRRPHTTSARHPATRPADSSLEQWPALIHTPHASRVTHTLTPEAQSILTHHRRIGCSLSSSPPRHALCQCCASPTLLHSSIFHGRVHSSPRHGQARNWLCAPEPVCSVICCAHDRPPKPPVIRPRSGAQHASF